MNNIFFEKIEQEFNKKIDELILKINNNNSNENDSCKENNINLLQKQIDELLPYKQKCLILNKEIDKLQIEFNMLKDKSEFENKLIKEKEEINKFKIKNIKEKFINKCSEFIKLNLSNKLDEFNSIIQNLDSEE